VFFYDVALFLSEWERRKYLILTVIIVDKIVEKMVEDD
jgi:hypothetical protein